MEQLLAELCGWAVIGHYGQLFLCAIWGNCRRNWDGVILLPGLMAKNIYVQIQLLTLGVKAWWGGVVG